MASKLGLRENVCEILSFAWIRGYFLGFWSSLTNEWSTGIHVGLQVIINAIKVIFLAFILQVFIIFFFIF